MQAITTATTTLALAACRVISGSPATGLTVLAVVLAGCADTESTSAFTWLRPSAAPAGWRVARIATGALLHYPPGWRPAPGDAGTATAVLLDPGHHISGYLNVTPRQGAEAPATWGSFRVTHNAAEGEREVKREALATGLRFRDGRGACVRDSYTTVSQARFIELACLVEGARAASVIGRGRCARSVVSAVASATARYLRV